MRSEYRSSIRSRMLIRSALLALMHEMPFDSITVTDVVRQADINRGTFYSHYRSTFDVIRKMEVEIAEEVLGIFRAVEVQSFISSPEAVLSDVAGYLGKEGVYALIFAVDMGGAFTSAIRAGLEAYLIQPQLGNGYNEAAAFTAAAIASALSHAVTEPSTLPGIEKRLSPFVVKLLSCSL